MGRKRRGRAVHGWMVIDKPAGMTSAAVVGKARRLTGAAKVGHGGTLDPLATGVLPLAFGEATKTVAWAMDGAKVYRFTVRWGEARATDDAEGAVTATSDARPTIEEIASVLPRFIGDIDQVPPAYSAVKVSGKRAYALARDNQPVDLPPRSVIIHRLELIGAPDADHAQFEAETGKGAYMRSLARDLAVAVGTVGHIEKLRRTRVGPFAKEDAISLEKLAALGHSAPLADYLLPVETALDVIPALVLTEVEARRLQRGQPLPVLPVASRSPLTDIAQGAVVCAMAEGRLVALARIRGGEIWPLRVLNV
ncbi:MAG: tRNA pseudouridine(55) synthase TruB [Rhodospirillales bacterium]|nr:tRNA pseudouridine(55) synthase TruB [Rhodospirillales bacterium]HJO71391.1 tRNA pseudouridine(55) synthase TruB [Rhodospirillales bacterium]